MDGFTRSTTEFAACGAVFAVSSEAGSSAVLVVSGELDLASVPYLDRFLSDHLARLQGPGGLELDLEAVSFFSAAGLGVLLGAAETARRTDVTLRVTALSPAVEYVLALTETRHHLDVSAGCGARDVRSIGDGRSLRGHITRDDLREGEAQCPGHGFAGNENPRRHRGQLRQALPRAFELTVEG